MAKLENLIDWIEFTIPFTSENEANAVSFMASYSPVRPASGMHGYSWSQKNEFGMQVMSNHRRKDMGVHVIMPGKQMQVVRDLGENCASIAMDVTRLEGRFSRIDVTADFDHVGLKPQHLMKEFEDKVRSGTARSASIIYELEQGSTLYVGSWKSERFARIYEKTRNFAGMDTALLRCELVNKGAYAAHVGEQLANEGVDAVVNASMATLDKMVGFKDERWIEMMKDKSQPQLIGRKKTDEGDEWLLNIVASSLAKRIIQSDGESFWEKFIDRVRTKADGFGVELRGKK